MLPQTPETTAELRWYALRTLSNCEANLADYLRALGLEIFLPEYLSRRQWNDRVKTIKLPLFPGYLFGRFGRKLPNQALGARGLAYVVGFGDGPVPIPETEIEAVRRVIENGVKLRGCPTMRVGVQVRVRSGPLKGVVGRLEKLKDECRLVIAIDLLGRSISTEIDLASIEVLI